MPVRIKKSFSWKCNRCGNVIEDDNPPSVCPVCEALHSYYELPEAVYDEPSEHEEAHDEEGTI